MTINHGLILIKLSSTSFVLEKRPTKVLQQAQKYQRKRKKDKSGRDEIMQTDTINQRTGINTFEYEVRTRTSNIA
jgi:hypothetical protein